MIFDPKHKILILNSGRFFATLNNSCKSAGTLALLLHTENCKKQQGQCSLGVKFTPASASKKLRN